MIGSTHKPTSYSGSVLHHKTNNQPARRGRLLVVALLLLFSSGAAAQDLSVPLTDEERAWLGEHPTITFVIDSAFPPFTFVDTRTGAPVGFTVDYMKLLEQKLGVTIRTLPMQWSEAVQLAMDHKVDGLVHAAITEERKRYLSFTNVYSSAPLALATRLSTGEIQNWNELAGRKIGITAGSSYIDLMKELEPDAIIVPGSTTLDLLNLMVEGKIDAVLDAGAVIYHVMNENNLGVFLKLNKLYYSDNHGQGRIAVRNDVPELLSMLNKAIRSVPSEEVSRLKSKWFGIDQPSTEEPAIILTPEERAWLTDHPEIRIGIMDDWPPMNYVDEYGSYRGIGVDYIEALNRQLNGILTIVPGPFKQSFDDVKAKRLDALMDITPKKDREPFFNFTQPYLTIPQVILGLRDGPYYDGEKDLHGKTVALERGFYTIERFRRDHPEITIREYGSTSDCLDAVLRGDADAYVGNRAVAIYLIELEFINNLRLMGRTSVPLTNLTIGVRKDWPLLTSILDKALEGISKQEKLAINRKWIAVMDKDSSSLSAGRLPFIALLAIVVGVLILFSILMWLVMRLPAKRFPRWIQTMRGRIMGMIAVTFFLALVVFSTWYGLRKLEHQTRHSVGDSLWILAQSTDESLRSWFDSQSEHIQRHAMDPKLLELVRRQLAVPRTPDTLLASDTLTELRAYFYIDSYSEYLGFFIISPDFISVASMRDENVGSRNLIAEQHPAFLQRAFAGETVFILPIRSDVPLPNGSGGRQKDAPTLFIASPLRADDGGVVAVMTLHIDPARDFTRLCQVGRIGKTGDTYAFDQTGLLLSGSRFSDDLARMGLVGEGETGILSIRISDPGGDLSRGYQPSKPPAEQPLTRLAASATAGRSGIDTDGYRDYRGVRVLGAWEWDGTLNIGIATEIDEHEALATHRLNQKVTIGILAIVVMLTLSLVGFIVWNSQRANQALKQARNDWERIAAERTTELRENELQFRSLFEGSQDAVILSVGEIFVNCNRAALEMLGYESNEELLALRTNEVLVPGQPNGRSFEELVQEHTPLAVSEKTKLFELVWRRKDGTSLHTEVQLSPAKFKGKPVIQAVIRDISERKLAEKELRRHSKDLQESNEALEKSQRAALSLMQDMETQRKRTESALTALRKSEEQFSEASSIAHLGYWELDLRTMVYHLSKPIWDILGASVEEEGGDSIGADDYLERFCYPEDRPIVERHTQIALAATEYTEGEFEYRFVRKDGVLRHVLTHYRVVVDAHAAPLMASGFYQDITELKKAEVEIKKLNSAIGQSPASVVITDIEGTLQYVNPYFTKITGYSYEEAIGQNPRILKSGEHDKEFYKNMWDTITAGKTWKGEIVNKKKNGEKYWESASISPVLNENDEIINFIGIKIDITEKKKVEEELKKAKEAAEIATKTKGEFLANMSHEIRTPMNAIIGMTDLALRSGLTPKQHNFVSKAHNSAYLLLGIINDILDFSKIEAGKLEIESINFNLNDVLNNLANINGIKAQEKGLELVIATAPDVPIALVGDPLRLGQVLLNLVSNAIKFTDRGEVVVSTELVKEQEYGTILRFLVKDSGIGMSRKQLSALFTPFTQADGSTTRIYGGTGLGLSISKSLVEQTGGEIGVESEVGKGSTFYFTVTVDRQTLSKRKYRLPSVEMKGTRVLLIGGHPVTRGVMKGYLQSFSFQVDAVAGKRAVRLIETDSDGRKYDLVLVDWEKRGGFPVEQLMQSENARPRIIAMVAANRLDEEITQVEGLGIEGILMKPVTQLSLFNAILQVFGYETRGEYEDDSTPIQMTEEFNTIRGAKILLVEDNEINQELAVELLREQGFWVTTANNGREAVERVRQDDEVFDAVLMDLQMPEMDGYEACAEIRKDKRFSELPIVAMTADAVGEVRKRVLEAGMDDYLSKPVEPSDLYAALLKWIKPGKKREAYRSADLIEMQEKEPDLPLLEGIDTEKGLQRMNGNKALYRKLLLSFKRDHAGIVKEISAALKRRDIRLAERLTHTLKGVAGNLGVEQLEAAAKVLDAELKKETFDEENVQTGLDRVTERLSMTAAEIEKVERQVQEEFSRSPGRRNKRIDTARINPLIEELRLKLGASDTEAAEIYEKMSEELRGTELEEALQDMGGKIDSFDFNGALEALERVAEGLGKQGEEWGQE